MDSPIKGLERLSEELKIERQKLNIALQERARVRVEVESHKQTIEQQRSEIQEYTEVINSLKDELEQANSRADVLQSNYDGLQEEARQRENQYQSWLQSSQDQTQSAVAYEEQLQAKDEEIKSLQILIETMDTKAHAKDDLIATLKDELLDLRRMNANNEHEKLEAYRYLSELDATNQDLTMKLHLADVSSHGLQERQSATEELRSELEESLQLNTSLNEQVRELNEKLQGKYLNERKLNEVASQAQGEKDSLRRECEELRQQVQSLLSSVRSESEAKGALAEKIASIGKNRDFLDDQVEELRSSVQSMQRNTLQLEEEIDQYKERLDEAYGELQAKEKLIEELSLKAHKADEMSPLLVEVDSLRTQLNALRKQMIKRDLEDQAGILPTRVLLDREQQGRSVYEGIIADLRAEVERLTVKYDEVMGRYERAMERASKVELLEEELGIYKEMAQNMSRETQTVAIAASEAVDRTAKHSHERQQLLQELHTVQTELLSAQTEIRRLKEEVSSLTDKLKQAHSEKMQADKKASEMYAATSKTEAALEDVRQQYDRLCIELERGKRNVHEYVFRLNDYERKEEQYKQIKGEYDKVCQELHHYKQERKDNADDSQYDLQRTQQHLDIKASELVTIRSKLENLEKDRQRLVQENVYLINNLEEAKKEKDHLRAQLEEEGRHKVEVQLAELKKDLAQSVTEWDDFEKEKTVKDGLIKQLQVDYTREKEKSHMLQRQCSVFEEKCKVLSQELSVYRSIDVYHSTLNAELKAYKEKSSLDRTTGSVYMSTSLPYGRSHTFTNTQAQSRAPMQVHATFSSVPLGRSRTPGGSAYKAARPSASSPGLASSRGGLGYVDDVEVSSPLPPNARRLSLEEMDGDGEEVGGSEQDEQLGRSVSVDAKQKEGGGRYGNRVSRGRGNRESSAHAGEIAEEQKQADARQERLKRKAEREQKLRESVLQQERGKLNMSMDSEGGRSGTSVFSYSPPKRTSTPPAYSKGGSVRDMSQMKKDLEKARRLISM